jgi:hypothetical protein
MAYIGREPQIGNFQVCDAISTVNNQAAYTMQVGGVNVSPETANHMLVSLNGILQAPTTSYTVSGSTITFASNLVTGDVINFIQILGSVLDLGVPSDSTVSLAKLTATGTKNSTTFLRGDNTFAEAGGGKVLQVVQVTKTDTFTSTATSFGDITGLSLAITPSATSSKILVNISVPFSCNAARAHFNLLRGSTDIIQGDASSSRIRTTYSGYADSTAGAAYYAMGMFSYSYLDSPATVSETTYKIQTRVNSGTMYVNRSVVDNDNSESGRAASTIILMEIGA